MAVKNFDITDIGAVKVTKRKGTKNLRIRLGPNGEVIVSQPVWLPYSAGTEFAKSHKEWIAKHRTEPRLFTQDMQVGKAHQLIFVRSDGLKPTVKLKGKYATVLVPRGRVISAPDVQAAAKRVARKALVAEKDYLKQRLDELAAHFEYDYRELDFKFMKSKWGSRRSDGRITLNYRLLDLPLDQIDYVICHELAHIKHMNHSPAFWKLVEKMVPEYKQKKKVLKTFKLTW